RKGDYEKAIKYYRAAIEMFVRFLRLYPDSSMADFYAALIKKYRLRIKKLEQHLQKVSLGGKPKEKEQVDDIEVIYPNQRNPIKFNDVVDLEHVKLALKRAVIIPTLHPELFPLGWPKGILLFGPPGCGKTLIAYALANEINAALIDVSPATIMSKWLGEAEKNVKRVFDKARQIASEGTPVIIFIDEVDGLLQQYSDEVGGEKRVRNQFLMEMDGLKEKQNNRVPVFVIGTTNKPWQLDIGFIRRFAKRIYVPPPNKEVRKQLFQHYITKLAAVYEVADIDLDKLAELTEGYSSADIETIVKEVQFNIAQEHFEKNNGVGKPRPITLDDFVKVIQAHKPSISPEMLKAYELWNDKHGTT
ncbi:MAG: AAA family ATPase, partial [Crenarchaeota archaeon]|nr:AAA family ATPase [Thermoproteota archaeon]